MVSVACYGQNKKTEPAKHRKKHLSKTVATKEKKRQDSLKRAVFQDMLREKTQNHRWDSIKLK